MAGVNPDGGAAADEEFRAGIRETMVMGLPPEITSRPTFYFPSDDSFLLAAQSGAPWDWTDTPISNDEDRAPIQVPCTVEVGGNAVDFTTVGEFNPQKAVVSLCDVDWAKVAGFHEVHIAGGIYHYMRVIQKVGLYSFTLIQVEVEAKDRP